MSGGRVRVWWKFQVSAMRRCSWMRCISREVTPVVRLWASDPAPPAALFLALDPEASSFTLAQFGSSRTPDARPTLRITYALPYPFEVQ